MIHFDTVKTLKQSIAIVSLVLCCSLANAVDKVDRTGFYVGGQLGSGSKDTLHVYAFASNNNFFDYKKYTKPIGWRVFTGYNFAPISEGDFIPIFGLEAGGTYSQSKIGLLASDDATGDIKNKKYRFDLMAKLALPVSNFDFYTKIGAMFARLSASPKENYSWKSWKVAKNVVRPVYSLGIAYNFKHIVLDLSYSGVFGKNKVMWKEGAIMGYGETTVVLGGTLSQQLPMSNTIALGLSYRF